RASAAPRRSGRRASGAAARARRAHAAPPPPPPPRPPPPRAAHGVGCPVGAPCARKPDAPQASFGRVAHRVGSYTGNSAFATVLQERTLCAKNPTRRIRHLPVSPTACAAASAEISAWSNHSNAPAYARTMTYDYVIVGA